MRAQLSRSCLCLALLASLWPNAAAADGGILILAGEGALALPPSAISSIYLDAEALARPVCGGGPSSQGGTVKCKVRLTTMPPTTHGLPPPSQYLLPEPISTPCGLWRAKMTLDPALVVPGALALTQAPEDPGHGVFASSFEINASFHLTNLETGEEEELLLPLAFSLSGPWALASPGEEPTDDNLYFLTYDPKGREVTFEGCIPMDFWKNNTYEVVEGDCKKCPEVVEVTLIEDAPSPDPSL